MNASRAPRPLPPRQPAPNSAALTHPDAWRELIRVTGLVRRVAEPHFERLGISGAQWGVLRALDRLEAKGMPHPRMHELGLELLVQPPSLSATVDRMTRSGLVARRHDADDHRSRRVCMTADGRRFLRGAAPAHRAWVDGIMVGLSEPERRRLGDLLGKLADHLARTAAGDAPARRQGPAPWRTRSPR